MHNALAAPFKVMLAALAHKDHVPKELAHKAALQVHDLKARDPKDLALRVDVPKVVMAALILEAETVQSAA